MIYLDSAATTLQKPKTVPRAVARAMTRFASPGRGGYSAAMGAAKLMYACREVSADFFHTSAPDQVVFTANATMALNLAIRSLVRPGMNVVMSCYEHNAVTRCVKAIPDVTVFIAQGPLFQSEAMVEAFRKQLYRADVVICNYVSNVFGYRLPVEKIAALCRESRVPFIVDASQAAGCLPVSVEGWGADFVAMPGHQGLYGPQGPGILLGGARSAPEPLLFGGTGSRSVEQEMPDFLPDRLEAGTANVPGIAGLLEGLRYVRRLGTERILIHEQRLIRRLGARLQNVNGVELFLAEDSSLQTGVLSFRKQGMDCEEIGRRLGEAGVAVRTGLHCAPLAHRYAGTLDTGTVRVSVSAFNTEREVDRLAELIRSFP